MIIIYLSGIDGCGKTTQSEKLVAWLNEHDIKADYQWLRWEPSIVPLLKKIRGLLSGPRSSTGDKKTAITHQENSGHAKWKNLKKRIMRTPFLKHLWLWYASHDYYRAYKHARTTWQGDVVVLDRYLYDFVIDQSLNFGISAQDFSDLIESTILKKMDRPDYSIVIDIPAKVGYERKLDGTPLEYLRERETRYQELPLSENTLHIDGTLAPDDIHIKIREWVSKRDRSLS